MPSPIFRGVPEPSGFSSLSKLDQVLYIQALWDRIADGGVDISVPPSHLALAEERLAAHRAHPSKARSAFETLDRLAARKP
jgi:putative addiction module component (TIGR02574 family)